MKLKQGIYFFQGDVVVDIKFQIFISSTYRDLIDERNSAIEAVLKIGHIPIGMEMFKAEDVTSWEIIKRTIESADYYVVIVGHKYGSIAKNGKSFTEMEYDYAVKLGIPTLAFIIDDAAGIKANQMEDNEEKRKKLIKFKEKLEKKNRDTWKDSSELSYKLISSLTGQFNINPRPGWVRNSKSLGNSIDELTRLSKENSELRERVKELEEKTKSVSRKPSLKVSFSNELTFKIEIPKKRLRVEKPIDGISYHERRENIAYNNSLSSIEQYDKYNMQNYSYNYARLNVNKMKLTLSNLGNIKATFVEVLVVVPKEVAISYDFELTSSLRLRDPNNCIDEYEEQEMQVVDVSNFKRRMGWLGGWTFYSDNIARLNTETLLHTKSIETHIALLPLKKGEYSIEVRYFCNEYTTQVIETIPIQVH